MSDGGESNINTPISTVIKSEELTLDVIWLLTNSPILRTGGKTLTDRWGTKQKENSSKQSRAFKPHSALSDITLCLCSRGVSISLERKENIDNGRFEEAPAGSMKTFFLLQPRHGPRNPRHNGHKPMKACIVFSLRSHRQYAAFLYSCFVFDPVPIGSKPTAPSISVMLGGWMLVCVGRDSPNDICRTDCSCWRVTFSFWVFRCDVVGFFYPSQWVYRAVRALGANLPKGAALKCYF